MCLILQEGARKKTATEDMIVYKVISLYCDGSYVTPYQYASVKLGETYTSELRKEKNDSIVEIGIHSFKNLVDARNEKNYWDDPQEIVKCIIPKGSKYYEGDFSCLVDSYASTALKYLEIIEQSHNL